MGDKKGKKDMERLLTTQQLSDYKTWPDGKSGIVFYIEELNGLYRIDCPWRKGAKWEEYNKLLPYEMEMCYDRRTIIDTKVLVSGFGAFMITYYVCHLTGANRSNVDFGKLVDVYFDYLLAHEDQCSIYREYMTYAHSWYCDNKDKWFKILCGEDADYDGFMKAWEKLLLKWRDKYMDELTTYKMLFEETLPISITMPNNRADDTYEVEIKYDDKVSENMPKTKEYEKENYWGRYNGGLFPTIEKVYDRALACYANRGGGIYKEIWDEEVEEDRYAAGFVAAYANYCMMNTFRKRIHVENSIQGISELFEDQNEFDPNKADYAPHSLNRKELFECYLTTRIEQTREYLEREDLDYIALKEEERADYVLGYILKDEIGFTTENDDLYDDLDGDKVEQIKTMLDGFLRYVYARIGVIGKYPEVKESYEGYFGITRSETERYSAGDGASDQRERYSAGDGDAARLATRYIEGGRLGDEGDEGKCKYISPFVTDEEERERIHKTVVNLVTSGFPMPYICKQLKQLIKEDKIALNVTVGEQYAELVRLGLPTSKKGYSQKNYENYI